MVQILSKLHEHEFSYSGRNLSQHQTSSQLLCIISLLRPVRTSSGYLDLFYAHCTHQITVRSVACDKLGVSERQL